MPKTGFYTLVPNPMEAEPLLGVPLHHAKIVQLPTHTTIILHAHLGDREQTQAHKAKKSGTPFMLFQGRKPSNITNSFPVEAEGSITAFNYVIELGITNEKGHRGRPVGSRLIREPKPLPCWLNAPERHKGRR